jgi:hypothetical protein
MKTYYHQVYQYERVYVYNRMSSHQCMAILLLLIRIRRRSVEALTIAKIVYSVFTSNTTMRQPHEQSCQLNDHHRHDHHH